MVTTPPTTTSDIFSLLPDDTLLDILTRLISDPRDWSRLSCVSSRFSNLIRSICCRSWCSHYMPNLAADLSVSSRLPGGWAALRKLSICCPGLHHAGVLLDEYPNPKCSRRPIWEPHFASAQRGFSREVGSKLLASRFRSDCLYVSQLPGCVHAENRRKYLLFRGVFKDFKETSVWKAVRDAKKSRIEAKCAFCDGKETWDLHSAFCLRRGLDFHQGEPVVRAFVCKNGHVSGAWVEKPMYFWEERIKLFSSRIHRGCLCISQWPRCVRQGKLLSRSSVELASSDAQMSLIVSKCALGSTNETLNLHSAFCLKDLNLHRGELNLKALCVRMVMF